MAIIVFLQGVVSSDLSLMELLGICSPNYGLCLDSCTVTGCYTSLIARIEFPRIAFMSEAQTRR